MFRLPGLCSVMECNVRRLTDHAQGTHTWERPSVLVQGLQAGSLGLFLDHAALPRSRSNNKLRAQVLEETGTRSLHASSIKR